MLPFESNLMIGSTFEPAQELEPHRSAAQLLRPSGSPSTALTDPHLRPLGSGPKLRTVSYGLGRKFTGLTLACSGGAVAPRGLAGAAPAWAGADGACAASDVTAATTANTRAATENPLFII